MRASLETSAARAQRFLKARDDGDVGTLMSFLSDVDYRYLAAHALGVSGAPEAAASLKPLLRATDYKLRLAAVRALGKLRARDAIEDLLDIGRSDPSRVVREWAAYSLGLIGEPSAVSGLRELCRDLDSRIADAAIASLFAIPTPDAETAAGSAFRELGWRRRRRVRRMRDRMGARY